MIQLPQIDRVPCLSTAHITIEDATLLQRRADERNHLVAEYVEGWFVWIDGDDWEGFSEGAQELFAALRAHGFYFVRFDRDGPIKDGLLTFDW